MRRQRQSRGLRMRRTLMVMLVAFSLAAIGVVDTASPAEAGNGDWYRLRSVNSTRCLEDWGDGRVLLTECDPFVPNDAQRWHLWHGGWVRNRLTEDCLTLLPGWDVGSRECDPRQENPYQFWYQFNGGWIRSAAGPADPVCVQATASTFSQLVARPCADVPWHRWDQIQF